MSEFSVAVALFDYLPVAATAVGLSLLARLAADTSKLLAMVAWLGVTLVVAGGFCKASWKLLLALQLGEISWLNHALFILLAPGFLLLGHALHHARRSWQDPTHPYPVRALILWLLLLSIPALLLAQGQGRSWFFYLLAATTVANIGLLVQAMLASRQLKTGWTAQLCFGYALLGGLAMGAASRLPEGETSAWIQESINLSAQLALAFGGWQLWRVRKNKESA